MWNFLKIDRLLIKSFTQNFKKRYNYKKKQVKDQIRKIVSQKKYPSKNITKAYVYTNYSIYLKELSGLLNCIFPWKTMDGYFWLSLGEQFLAVFFSSVFFLRPRRKYTRKKPGRNLVNENSSKIRRNTSLQERWKNYGRFR